MRTHTPGPGIRGEIFPMFYLHLETHDECCVLIPSLSVCRNQCDCCEGEVWAFTLDFLVWSIGIGWASH
jgi:hypothetical protein